MTEKEQTFYEHVDSFHSNVQGHTYEHELAPRAAVAIDLDHTPALGSLKETMEAIHLKGVTVGGIEVGVDRWLAVDIRGDKNAPREERHPFIDDPERTLNSFDDLLLVNVDLPKDDPGHAIAVRDGHRVPLGPDANVEGQGSAVVIVEGGKLTVVSQPNSEGVRLISGQQKVMDEMANLPRQGKIVSKEGASKSVKSTPPVIGTPKGYVQGHPISGHVGGHVVLQTPDGPIQSDRSW